MQISVTKERRQNNIFDKFEKNSELLKCYAEKFMDTYLKLLIVKELVNSTLSNDIDEVKQKILDQRLRELVALAIKIMADDMASFNAGKTSGVPINASNIKEYLIIINEALNTKLINEIGSGRYFFELNNHQIFAIVQKVLAYTVDTT